MAFDARLIDWRQPWLADWRALGEPLADRVARGRPVCEAASDVAEAMAGADADAEMGSCPVRFVPTSALPAGQAYEVFVAVTAQVPTRDNLHDFFNALAWLRFPRLKRQLNAVHAQAIASDGVAGHRGARRDRTTVFDENGALWWAPETMSQALRGRKWHTLFVQQRAAWPEVRLTLFGHALLEKLVSPRKAITAHLWCVGVGAGAQATASRVPDWDPAVALTPLPVLGVPGWDAANENAGFYDDPQVFRV